jgi:putative Mg2+ transporter-C (MgtC) family protein
MNHVLHTVQEQDLLKIAIALLFGALLGLEREYKRKAAGIRTITLICVSSTLFTILSAELGYPNSADRVASNILTGVGFIGAGVIFKGDFTIDGITTAATIWIAAALGMAIGMSEYVLATVTLLGAFGTLLGLEFLESWINRLKDKRTYVIRYIDRKDFKSMEPVFRQFRLKYKRLLLSHKRDALMEDRFEVTGKPGSLELLNEFLMSNQDIYEFEVQSNPL